MAAEQTNIDGFEIIILQNDMLEARLAPACGSNVYALRDVQRNLAILGEPPQIAEMLQRPYSYGTPVLFPPNRIENGVFEWGGRTYRLDITRPGSNQHLHGVVAKEAWELVSVEDGPVQRAVTRLRSWEHPNVIRQWPHRFELEMTCELDGSTLLQRIEIRNVGDDAMPWGLGYHTRFNMPIATDGSQADCRLSLSVDGRWELDANNLPTGRLLPLERNFQEGIPGNVELDDLFRAASPNVATLTDTRVGIRVSYAAEPEFIHWIIFTLNFRNSGFSDHVCFEPYTWMTNAPNLDLPAEVTGVRSLEPGQSTACTTRLTVEPL